MNRILPVALALIGVAASAAGAAVVTRNVDYSHDGVALEGFLAYDDAVSGPRPGVLIVHQWLGLTDNERMRARMLAEMGYVAFAVDVYGKGIRPANTDEAAKEAGKYYEDRALWRSRIAAGLDVLRKQKGADPARIAAIGYCFGGGGVLELARSGADLAGVVTFHGSLDTPNPEDARNIRAKVLVCHGAADPYVKREDVNAFIDEMEGAGVDYQLVMYSQAVHSFTQKAAGDDPSRGAAYNANADRRSWQAMKDFFAEIF